MGYKKEFFHNINSATIEDITCQLCGDILQDAILILGCQHNFCRECLLGTELNGCPIHRCNAPLRCTPNITVDNFLRKVHISCPNYGCPWHGLLKDFPCHTNNYCLEGLYNSIGEGERNLPNVWDSYAGLAINAHLSPDFMREEIKSRFPVDGFGVIDLTKNVDTLSDDVVRSFYNAFYHRPQGDFIPTPDPEASPENDPVCSYLNRQVNLITRPFEELMNVPSDGKNVGGGVYQCFSVASLCSVASWMITNANKFLSKTPTFLDAGAGANLPAIFFSLLSGYPSFGIEIDKDRFHLAASAMLRLLNKGLTGNVALGLFLGDLSQPMNYAGVNVIQYWDRAFPSSIFLPFLSSVVRSGCDEFIIIVSKHHLSEVEFQLRKCYTNVTFVDTYRVKFHKSQSCDILNMYYVSEAREPAAIAMPETSIPLVELNNHYFSPNKQSDTYCMLRDQCSSRSPRTRSRQSC